MTNLSRKTSKHPNQVGFRRLLSSWYPHRAASLGITPSSPPSTECTTVNLSLGFPTPTPQGPQDILNEPSCLSLVFPPQTSRNEHLSHPLLGRRKQNLLLAWQHGSSPRLVTLFNTTPGTGARQNLAVVPKTRGLAYFLLGVAGRGRSDHSPWPRPRASSPS